MTDKIDFDVAAAHHYFAAHCFNKAWDLIDKSTRTPEEDEQMIQLSLASQWHWAQRKDYSPTHQSIGAWQTSRIYAILGQAENSRRYGLLSLEASQKEGVGPFYLGYAYEALARAESVDLHWEKATEYLKLARQAAERVPELDEKKLLLSDLETIQVG
jgi:hypothetical protein